MKGRLFTGMLAAAIAVPASSGVSRADDFRCSTATLKGAYAFGVTAYTPAGLPDGPPQVIAGIAIFDGNGKFTQRDYAGDSLRIFNQTDFSPVGQEGGTYNVNSDCTGSNVLNLNVLGIPPVTTQGGKIETVFVISNGGRHIHGVVSRFTPPGATGPAPTQTSFDHWKVASEQDD
jgi:hypothetical protein